MANDQPRTQDEAPNAVLRGGPFDGETLVVSHGNNPVKRRRDGEVHYYRPTGELDDEYPTLAVFAHVLSG